MSCEVELINDEQFAYLMYLGAGATFDWTFFDNSKLINFDD
jgi:hypothetical protein